MRCSVLGLWAKGSFVGFLEGYTGLAWDVSGMVLRVLKHFGACGGVNG